MQIQQVCKDFLRMRRGAIFDGVSAAQMLNEHWGIKVDWHEMSYALDYLERSQEAERTGIPRDGMITYIIS